LSIAAVAMTAIIVAGVQVTAVIAAGAWLIYVKRILFAATPRPQQPSRPQAAPVDIAARRTGT